MKTIRIGIAGLGRMGKSHALNLARHTEGAALVGACSPVAAELDWARTQVPGIVCHADLTALLRQPDIDAVKSDL